MKKFIKTLFSFLLLGILLVAASSCEEETGIVKVIAPTGTPALGLAHYAKNNDNFEIVSGSDPLIAAFSSSSHDVIVAPINLGAKMYNTYSNYLLYKVFVYGNLYVVSTKKLDSLSDLNGKTITLFSKNQTPDIVFRSLASYNELNVNTEYATDVTECNALLTSGKADYIISAEPSLSKISKVLSTKGLIVSKIDLQEEWSKMTGTTSYPQAAIFVKKEVANKSYVIKELEKMISSVKLAKTDVSTLANDATIAHASFNTIGEETLISAIPNCHFDVMESDVESVEYYLQKMIDLGFAPQVGGKLPDHDFYF